METYVGLRAEIRHHTAVITLKNPPANVWDIDNLQVFHHLIQDLEHNPEVHTLILTGAGQRFFSAGADLKRLGEGNRYYARELAKWFGRAFESVANWRGVTIAALNGYAMGGGLEVALACDIRIADEHVQLGLPETSVGLLPCAGGTQRLTRLVGEGWAKRLILCGETLRAKQAEHIGLVEQVVPSSQALTTAIVLAEKVARQSPAAVYASKKLIHHRHTISESGFLYEREAFLDLFDGPDPKEGLQAFIEKRPAVWSKSDED